ncbi:MAG: LysR family transcriptional regulator, partial [Haliea sp.]
MTLNQIRAFVAVAHNGGFTAAARMLRMSHSTLNSQIQIMERDYGAELFHRRGRRVELSALGLEMLPLARRMIALEGDMNSLLDGSGKLLRGSLKIAAVGPFHVTEMIEAFHATH